MENQAANGTNKMVQIIDQTPLLWTPRSPNDETSASFNQQNSRLNILLTMKNFGIIDYDKILIIGNELRVYWL